MAKGAAFPRTISKKHLGAGTVNPVGQLIRGVGAIKDSLAGAASTVRRAAKPRK